MINGKLAAIAIGEATGNSRLFALPIAALATSSVPEVAKAVLDLGSGTVPNADAAANIDHIFDKLSPSSLTALGVADGMRLANNQDRIHMEHLILGLLGKKDGPAARLFRSAEIDHGTLNKIIEEKLEIHLSQTYSLPSKLTIMPALSGHVQEALLAAASIAAISEDSSIRSRHLLYGTLSVEKCTLIKELIARGARKENIALKDVDKQRADPPKSASSSQRRISLPISAMAFPTPKVLSDRWSDTDKLGYEAYARTIAGVITHEETLPPLTIGIKAPWGAGKTSLMKRVQHLLDGDAAVTEENEAATRNRKQVPELSLRELIHSLSQVIPLTPLQPKPSPEGTTYGVKPRVTVWFNAWKYQTSEQIWAGLAHCIISQVTARMLPRDREYFWLRLHARRVNREEVRRKVYELVLRQLIPWILTGLLATAGAFVVASYLPILPILGIKTWYASLLAPLLSIVSWVWKGGEKLGGKAGDSFKELVREPDYEGKMGFLYLVESDIRDVLDLVATKKTPLVVFVDDLDRCIPNKVAEVVEAINLSLSGDYPNCVFVLGMEPGMVAAALEVANKDVIERAKQMLVADSPVPLGWRFMEKIVQLPVTIPPPTEAGVKAYLGSLTNTGVTDSTALLNVDAAQEIKPLSEEKIQEWMNKLVVNSVAEVISVTDKLLDQAPLNERTAIAEASKRRYAEKFTDRDPVIAQFLNSVVALVGGNPRQIKRYVNTFRFYSTLRHNLDVDAKAHQMKLTLPSDGALAKFIALSVQWPHAIDSFRITRDASENGNVDGETVTMLALLEEKSQTIAGNEPGADAEWLLFLQQSGFMLGDWANTRSFRQFLARGENIGRIERCGLW